MMRIAEYSSDNGIRSAVVLLIDNEYTVELYLDGNIVETIVCKDKNQRWAEDLAENYCLYIC